MKLIVLILLLSIVSCKQKTMTLEELQKAKWTTLTQGIDYISTQKAGPISEKDSIDLKLMGTAEDGLLTVYMDKKDSAVPGSFSIHLKEYLVNSKAGYLKVNLFGMLMGSGLEGQVYLRGDYSDPFSFSQDSAILLSIPGIRSARFISKEDAKKKYLADGNDDWSKILDENPLPNAIEIKLENKSWTKESLEELETIITQKVIMAAEFSYPGLLFESDKYYFFEYKRT